MWFADKWFRAQVILYTKPVEGFLTPWSPTSQYPQFFSKDADHPNFLDGKSLDDDVLEGAQKTKVFLERMSDGESPFVRDDDDGGDDEEIDI